MADVHDKKTRSFNMSRIRAKDTKPEMTVRRFLHAKGLRYKLHDKSLAGKPDLVFPKYNTVLFVNGCFWHGHENCRYFRLPKTKTEWWRNKIETTKEKDRQNTYALQADGWNTLEVFECQLKKHSAESTLNSLYHNIINGNTDN